MMLATWKKNASDTNGTYTLYVDGVQVAQALDAPKDPGTGNEYQVGGGYGYPSSTQFIGYVQDLKYYSRAFTAQEAAAAYLSLDVWIPAPDASGIFVNQRTGEVYVPCATHAVATTPTWAEVVRDIAGRASPLLPPRMVL